MGHGNRPQRRDDILAARLGERVGHRVNEAPAGHGRACHGVHAEGLVRQDLIAEALEGQLLHADGLGVRADLDGFDGGGIHRHLDLDAARAAHAGSLVGARREGDLHICRFRLAAVQRLGDDVQNRRAGEGRACGGVDALDAALLKDGRDQLVDTVLAADARGGIALARIVYRQPDDLSVFQRDLHSDLAPEALGAAGVGRLFRVCAAHHAKAQHCHKQQRHQRTFFHPDSPLSLVFLSFIAG